MKIRKKYTIVLFDVYEKRAVLCKHNSSWVQMIEDTCELVKIYDCTFRQAVNFLRVCSDKGYDVYSRRD